jgi:hypothetical protein
MYWFLVNNQDSKLSKYFKVTSLFLAKMIREYCVIEISVQAEIRTSNPCSIFGAEMLIYNSASA